VRIALVVERFEPGSGGVERAAFALASELARRGHALTAVCRAAGPTPAGVAVRRLRVPAFWQPLRLRRFSAEAARATASGFDVVHSFARTRHQHVYRAGGGSHAAYLERMHRHPALRARLSPRHRTILAIEEAVFRDPSQLVQCNAEHTAREIRARYAVDAARIAVIYNGVDTERFRPRAAARRLALRAALDLAGARVALFAGDGFARKGLDRAIEALAKAPRVVLLVAGGGAPERYREQARRLGVADRVRFLGRRADLAELHAVADLFVLPTRYDAFSNACLEAMASGIPVATTRENGAAELIVPGVNGLLIEDDEVGPAYAWLEDGERLGALGRAARDTAEHHTWERHADAVLALYARACTTR
jgi:UDP-glucose:(heptosyl)LPS alpha-1,3-glucosyltransferase